MEQRVEERIEVLEALRMSDERFFTFILGCLLVCGLFLTLVVIGKLVGVGA
jgi:hypothetical protein